MHPGVQAHMLSQFPKRQLAVADTMDLWIQTAPKELAILLKQVDGLVLNYDEAELFTSKRNPVTAAKHILEMGPRFVIVKKGEHGSILSGPGGLFIAPAFPLKKVVDPTGAGDSFVGGLMGYLAGSKGPIETNLRRAMVYGSVTASFCCEGFGLNRTTRTTRADIEKRVKELLRMAMV